MEQFRRQLIRDSVIRKLQQDGKIVPINVTDAEISAEFEKAKAFLPKKPATVTFKQIVIAPQPTAAAKEVARVKAESLLAQLKTGGDFEKLAKRESMDPADEGKWRRPWLGAPWNAGGRVRAMAVRHAVRSRHAAWTTDAGRSRRRTAITSCASIA